MPQNPYDAFDTPVRRAVTPSDPTLPGKITGQGLQNAKDRADLTRTQGMTPAEIAKAVADAQRSEADAERIRLETEATRLQQEQAVRAREGNVSNLAQMISNLDALQADASDNGGWFETGYTGSLLRDRPGTAAYDLKGRVTGVQGGQFIEALRNLKSQSATGATGAGALTEQEGNRILAATGNLDPNQSQQQFVDQIAQARQAALEAYRRLGGADPNIDPEGAVQRRQQQQRPPAPSPDYVDQTNPLVGGPGRPDQTTFGTDYRDEVDPVLKGVAGKLGGLLAAGRSDQEIRQFLLQNGVDPSTTNVNAVLQYRRTPEYKVWQRANPGKAYPIGSDFYTKKVPLSFSQKVGNAAAQSGAGAYFISAGQAVTGNRLDDLAGMVGGDADAVNTGVQLSRANSPTASFAGDLTGQTLAQYLMGRVPGFRALPGSSLGRMADDAAYGFYAGSGDNEDGGDWLTNGLTGAGANTLGGKLGRGVAKGGKTLLTGIQDDSLRYLHQRGVPLTLGQISRGSGGAVGDSIAGIEERVAGMPVIDGIVRSARRRGDEGFNQAAFREFGGSGLTGSRGIGEGQDIMRDAYAFLGDTEFPIDTLYRTGQSKVKKSLPFLPSDHAGQIGKEIKLLDLASQDGVLKGRDWQSGLSMLRGNRSSVVGTPFSERTVNTLGDMEDNLLNLAYRQGGPRVEQQLIKANTQNGQFNTLVKALDNGPTQRADELFSPSRLDTAARSNAKAYGGRISSMAGDRPFYDLTTAGMKVMPNLTPDSGTAGRAILAVTAAPYLLGTTVGGAYGAADDKMTAGEGAKSGADYATKAVLPTLALASLYSKTGQKTLGKLLLSERPAVFNTISDKLNADNYIAKALRSQLSSRRAGQIGGTTLRDLIMYPELQIPGQ